VNHLSSFFPDPRGRRLRYQYWEPGAKAYSRVALLLHGPARHSGSYPRLLPPLLGAGFKVYALDFAGFGASPGERGAGGLLAMADAVEALCRRIESAELGREIGIVAHSMGAVAALLFLKRYPSRRAGLAALSPLLFGAQAEAGPAAAELSGSALPPALAEELGRVAGELLAEPSFLEGRSAAFLVGEEDPLVPRARLEAAVAALPLDPKRILAFPGARHDLLGGEAAEEVAGALIAWFDETKAERPAPERGLG